MFRYLHSLVATRKRFDSVAITFPVRGHSYLECDKNMGLINQKSAVETPDGWRTVFEGARHSPSAFVVVNCQQSMFRQFTKYLSPGYKPVCPFQTCPVKEFRVEKDQPHLVYLRDSFNGAWTGEVLEKTLTRKGKKVPQPPMQPQRNIPPCYKTLIPLKKAKYNDLQQLAKFCSEASALYYKTLPHSLTERKK